MRVISGTCKGRHLQAVPGLSTRPTTDKVKEAVFNMIGPYFAGGIGLDLFAGSGGLGIEALSRGLERVIFVDHDGKAVQTVRKNVAACGLERRAEIYRNDAERALRAVAKRGLRFSVIFLDPPYKEKKWPALLSFIASHDLLEDDGVVVAEHLAEAELPEEVGRLKQWKRETYGITGVTIYRRTDEQKGDERDGEHCRLPGEL
ncbi:16S rRNA (guanine(966)-N(2))-methyltransferase RsmD [Geobacillus stearothermophilus]|uniref:16S rRNA (guanine(966)-N(2))-methyltransferase RsmD n=1 Tax=Geobacillus TaxID=129337 RepID=UPI0005CCC1CB|nr:MULTISPECIES: 16S rRNA (guanine(966)-N(2))-methyltransferase RsmD [Geobacillus]AKM18412.1 Ribosomal RNA small subunit methyltransferase D [Geobacillus sp. 12AMOR1]AKU27608.1 DNA methyltransferase [Geobacillus sp. LC300]ASS88352.1 16S rRNA (guanine(966)-N(2))-methyltransferase RsmD [Geobacillus lituanicus]MED0654492.1 16S rRNA (guanine(966)-N(2))-methyltransferase RsmD [Anoxybacillus geothermalis]STO11614.1 Ribosomal RNA small subunit methyltransferase D [[Flavobacterium] thermophilum]